VSPESGGVFIVSLEGVDLHVVCVSVEQALEQAEALSQQRQRRVIVQEENHTEIAAMLGPEP